MNTKTESLYSPTESHVPSSVTSRIDFQIPNFGGSLQTPVETCDPEKYQAPVHDDDIPIWPQGWRPWSCLFGCFLLMFNSWGLVNAYGTFASYYSTNHLQGSTTILLNLVGSTQSFIVLILSAVAGRLLDAGHARQLILLGGALITLGMFCLSAVKPLNYGGIWAAQGLCVGLGMACFFVTSSQVAATWFIKRKTIAIGIVACGASVAGALYPILLRVLLQRFQFSTAVQIFSVVPAATSLLAYALAVPNPKHVFRKPQSWKRPEVWVDMDAFRNPAFNWFTAGVCFMFFGFYAIFFNFEDWAASKQLAKKVTPAGLLVKGDLNTLETYWFLCIINGSSTLGRIFSATMAERFGTVLVHSISTFIASLLVLLLWTLTNTQGAAIAFCVLFGAVSGAVIGLPPASIAFILGRSDPLKQAKLGHWTGMMYTIAASFAMTGPVIVGYLYGKYGIQSYVLQGFCGGCLLIGSVCMLVAKCYTGPLRMARAIAKARKIRGSIVSIMTRENSKDNSSVDLTEKA